MLHIHNKNRNMFEHSNLSHVLVNKKFIFYTTKNPPRAWRDATPNSTSICFTHSNARVLS